VLLSLGLSCPDVLLYDEGDKDGDGGRLLHAGGLIMKDPTSERCDWHDFPINHCGGFPKLKHL